MWSMAVVLTETENENDSANQNYVAKMTLQKLRHNVAWRQLLYSTNPLIAICGNTWLVLSGQFSLLSNLVLCCRRVQPSRNLYNDNNGDEILFQLKLCRKMRMT